MNLFKKIISSFLVLAFLSVPVISFSDMYGSGTHKMTMCMRAGPFTQTLDQTLLSGLTLAPEAYFKLNESSGTTATNMVPNLDAIYVGSPTLAAAGDVYNETNGGNAITTNGSSSYVNLGAGSVSYTARIATGLTILVNFKDLRGAGGSGDTLIGVADSSGKGFKVKTWGGGQPYAFQASMTDAAGSAYSMADLFFNVAPGTEYMNQNMWLEIYFKAPSTIKVYMDGNRYTGTFSSASGSAGGTFSNTTNNVYLGASNNNGTAGNFFKGTIQRFAEFSGELTEADRLKYMRKATRTDTATGKLYRVVAEYSPRTSTGMKILSNGIGAVTNDGDPVGLLPDETGNGNNALQPTVNADPSLDERGIFTIDGGINELDLDNSYQNSGDATQRRQAYAWSNGTNISAMWSTIAAITRPTVNQLLGIGTQTIASVGGGRLGLIIGGAAGIDSIAARSVSASFVPAAGFPCARVLPGYSIAAVTMAFYNTNGAGAAGAANIFSNRTYAPSSTSMVTGDYGNSYSTSGVIGGDPTTYGDLFAGRLQDIVISNAPMPQTALNDWYDASIARIGIANHAPKHILLGGDSITSMNAASRNRGYQNFLPKTWSYTNPSRGGDQISNGITRLTANGAAWFDLSSTKIVGMFMLGTNDELHGRTLNQMKADYDTWRTDALAAGANYIVAADFSQNPANDGVGWKSYAATLVSLGKADLFCATSNVPTADGIHPTTPGHATLGASFNTCLSAIP